MRDPVVYSDIWIKRERKTRIVFFWESNGGGVGGFLLLFYHTDQTAFFCYIQHYCVNKCTIFFLPPLYKKNFIKIEQVAPKKKLEWQMNDGANTHTHNTQPFSITGEKINFFFQFFSFY